MIKIFTLNRCDTCRKAIAWLVSNDIDHKVIDIEADGILRRDIQKWLELVGWEALLNKRSRTWRDLSIAEQKISNNFQAEALMFKRPKVIKRPIILCGTRVLVGFDEAQRLELLSPY